VVDLSNPETFKLSKAECERYHNSEVRISNSVARKDPNQSMLAAMIANETNYRAMTVDGKPIGEIIKGL
jgi:hypothetical protein